MTSRRNQLKDLQTNDTTHAGLWLDKFLISQESKANDKKELVNQIAMLPMPEDYKKFYERWKKALTHLEESGLQMSKAIVNGRMAVGLGTESVLETGITLHHTYGVPYIPGSSLKGLASSYANQYLGDIWKKGTDAYTILFGASKEAKIEQAGYVHFFDALYIPDTEHNKQALHPDVITVHHEKYYQNKNEAPTDWDSTNPISFLSATGSYLIALSGPTDWVMAAFTILKLALENLGIGAKTSSSYGRMSLEIPSTKINKETPLYLPIIEPDTGLADSIIGTINSLRPNEVAGSISVSFDKWKSKLISTKNKLRVAKAILNKILPSDKKLKEKYWYKELVNYVETNSENKS